MNASVFNAMEFDAKSVLLGFVDPRLAFVFPRDERLCLEMDGAFAASIRRNPSKHNYFEFPAHCSLLTASQAIELTTNEGTVAKADIPNERAAPSKFVNSEPIREDQVQNAVKFLSHPKVVGSPVMYRRSFLERKGLTKEEIDEAFRRVPDPTPIVAASQPVTALKMDN